MITITNILAPSATLTALCVAIFVFSLPRAIMAYKKGEIAIKSVDVPEKIKQQKFFFLCVYQDSLLSLLVSFVSLVLAFLFIFNLWQISSVDIGKALFTNEEIITLFSGLVWTLGLTILVLGIISVISFGTEAIIGKSKLSPLAKLYLKLVNKESIDLDEVDQLIPEAILLINKGDYSEAVLNSVATLEATLKNKFRLPNDTNFAQVIINLSEELTKLVSIEELNYLRKIRNLAAHPNKENEIVKNDAEKTIETIDKILDGLQGNYRISMASEVQKDISGLRKKDKQLIIKKITTLGKDPKIGDIKRTKEQDFWITRIDDWRIEYSINDEKRQIIIIKIYKKK